MKSLRKSANSENIYLYVAFHTPLEMSPIVSGAKIKKEIGKVFEKDEYRLEFISSSQNGGEVIYRFQKPLLMSDSENEKFFYKLKAIFRETETFNPHFTQNNLN